MTDSRKQSTGQNSDESLLHIFALRIEGYVKSAWQTFFFDYKKELLQIKDEGLQCGSEFLLSCIFCLICAITFVIVENPATTTDEISSEMPEIKYCKEKRETLEISVTSQILDDLWSNTSLLSEEDWKKEAFIKLEELKGKNNLLETEDCVEETEQAEELDDWGILNSFVYVLTVTTTIGMFSGRILSFSVKDLQFN